MGTLVHKAEISAVKGIKVKLFLSFHDLSLDGGAFHLLFNVVLNKDKLKF